VRLPIPIVIDGQVIHALGTFGLPSLSGEDARTVSLTEPVEARSLELVTTLIGTPGLAAGTPVASLTVTEANRTTSMLLLRTGFETNTWDGRCQPGTCTPAYTWRKRLALVGAERYPQSWSDFEAALFAAEMPLNRPVTITSLRLARLPSPGTLYVWALVLHP
jgi:hypothetical protein